MLEHWRKKFAGEAVSDEELISSHAELMPELADALRRLEQIQRAQHEPAGRATWKPSRFG